MALTLSALLAASAVTAEESNRARAGRRRAAEPATVSVITFGPGDHPFSKFGHDALWIHDPGRPPAQRDLVFNYGTFRFDSPWLIVDFLQGKLSYWLSASSMTRTLQAYRAANRTVRAQRLSLPPETVRELTAFLYDNVKPDNRYYRYDYYRDNCATRIRDALDRHLGGRLAAASTGPARMTYRQHTRRLTVDAPLLYFGLDLAMGPLIDEPLTQWEAMFLPDRVEAKIGQLRGDDGAALVSESRVLFQAERAKTLDAPVGFRWGWLGIGVSLGGLLAGLGFARGRWGRTSQAAALAVVGSAVGLLGTLLLILWFLTDHDVTYYNRNVLLCPVWGLAFPVLAWGFCRDRDSSKRLMMRGAAAAAACAVVALLLSAVTRQSSGPALSLLLPVWLGAAAGVWERCRRPALRSLLAGGWREPAGD